MPASATMDGLGARHRIGASAAERPRPAARLRARLGARHLDHELARGVDPASDPALEVRARRLVSLRTRTRLAESLEEIQRSAVRPAGISSRVPVRRDAVIEARAELGSLAAALRANGECQPRGVALVQILITDGAGPLYGRGPEVDLVAALNEAHQALRLGAGD